MATYFLEYKTAAGKAKREVTYFNDYHPWRNGKNPLFNKNSSEVLDFKKGRASAVLYFAVLIDRNFNPDWENCCCVAVPSSDPQKSATPVHELIRILVSLRPGLKNGSNVLVRKYAIKKLATGGKRSKEIHLNSIRINSNCSVNIAGKDILLIDDVITTGNSLLACVDKLKEGGAKRVFLLTIAKTV